MPATPHPLTLSYLAGIVDADGTIGITRTTRHGTVSFSERVSVKQREPEAVALLHATFGGSRSLAHAADPHRRPLHVWSVSDRAAASCLAALRNALLLKRRQADTCLELRTLKDQSRRTRLATTAHRGTAPRSPHCTAQMDALYHHARWLNAGPHPPATSPP